MAEQESDSWVRVARIGKPHGIKGEVTVQLFTDDPGLRFSPGTVLHVMNGAQQNPEQNSAQTLSELTVAAARWNKSILVVKFEEIVTRNEAEAHRNVQLYADAEQDDDAWYESDLLDFTVEADGQAIGAVSGLIPGEGQDLLEISLDEGHSALIPFVEEIVSEIDEEARIVRMTPPAGLLDLNRAED